jgi:23S rRNA (guanosine2251-2'-O)-methyltransferase
MRSPRDMFITVYGRRPVLEVLDDPALEIDKIVLATNAVGAAAEEILQLAGARGVPVVREPPERVTRLSRNGRQDQGVVADVRAAGLAPLGEWVAQLRAEPRTVLVLDGVTNPANVGMILRTATAAGLDGVVLPRRGTADLGPLVIKASAGIAFRAPILRAATVEDALDGLTQGGFTLVGLAADAPASLFDATFGTRTALVLGSESEGVTAQARPWIHEWVSIPMARGVESLNVASAAAVVAYELSRRG